VPVPAGPDAEHEAPARQVPERLDLTGQGDRMVVGQDQEPGGQADSSRDAGGVGQAEKGRHPDRAVETRRLQEVLGHPERVETEVLGLSGELLDTRGLVEAEIAPRKGGKVHAEAHWFRPRLLIQR